MATESTEEHEKIKSIIILCAGYSRYSFTSAHWDAQQSPECEGAIVNTGILIKGGLLLWLERQVLIYRQVLWRASTSRLV